MSDVTAPVPRDRSADGAPAEQLPEVAAMSGPPRAAWVTWLAGALLLGGALTVGLAVGPAHAAAADIVGALWGDGDAALQAIARLRWWRGLGAALTGAALGLGGLLLQSATRNPLADPYLLGTSAGATLSMVAMLTLAAELGLHGLLQGSESLWALVGAMAAAGLALRIGQRAGGQAERVVLAGLVLTAFAGAASSLLLLRASDAGLRAASQWLMGGVAVSSPWTLALPALALAVATPWAARRSARLDALCLGRDAATGLGVPAAALERGAVLWAAVLAAVAVALAGIVGFVGLLVPHGARALVGGGHARLVPAVVFGGGAALVVLDAACRVVVAPAELPIGIPTALMGVPLLLALLRRRDRPAWAAAPRERQPPLGSAAGSATVEPLGPPPADAAPPAHPPALACRDLRVGYGDELVLAGLDLAVPAGTLVAILGANGAGKSTLLRALAGALADDAYRGPGAIYDAGQARRGPNAPAGRIAWLPQQVWLDDAMTVEALIDLGGRLDGLSAPARAARCAEALRRAGIDDLRARALGTLSGGQRQRALIALALARPAPVLLLDEPTTGLDIVSAADVLGLLADVAHREGRTVIVTVHDLVTALALADVAVVLARGRALVATIDDDGALDVALAAAFGPRVLALLGRAEVVAAPPRR